MHQRIRSLWAVLMALVSTVLVVAACSDGAGNLLAPGKPTLSTTPTKVIKTAQAAAAASRSGEIGEAGGTITIEGGHSIYFPPGSLPQVTTITAERIEGSHIIVKFGPHGINFPADKYPTLTLDYSTAENPDLTKIVIGYVDESGTILEWYTSSIDETNKKVTAKLPHFSQYAVVE